MTLCEWQRDIMKRAVGTALEWDIETLKLAINILENGDSIAEGALQGTYSAILKYREQEQNSLNKD